MANTRKRLGRLRPRGGSIVLDRSTMGKSKMRSTPKSPLTVPNGSRSSRRRRLFEFLEQLGTNVPTTKNRARLQGAREVPSCEGCAGPYAHYHADDCGCFEAAAVAAVRSMPAAHPVRVVDVRERAFGRLTASTHQSARPHEYSRTDPDSARCASRHRLIADELTRIYSNTRCARFAA